MKKNLSRLNYWLAGTASTAAILLGATHEASAATNLNKIGHIIVIYEENHPFDGYFGNFPGVNGLRNVSQKNKQVNENGYVYSQMPPIFNTNTNTVDPNFPTNLPNAPFNLNRKYDATHPGYTLSQIMGDLVHRFYQEQIQIDAGRMDRFALVSDAGGLSMGYNDISSTYLWSLAKKYTLLDNFFHPAFGGSFLNHQWLVCACSPTDTGTSTPTPSSVATSVSTPPTSQFSVVSPGGNVTTDAQYTPDGYAVNTIRSVLLHDAGDTKPNTLLAPQYQTTIGDRLDAAGVNWVWYSGGYNAAAAANAASNWTGVDPLFQYHHQAFAFYAVNAPLGAKDANGNVVGTAQTEAHRKAHLKDRTDLVAAIDNGTLPPVTFYKPVGEDNEHPGYSAIATGDADLQDLIENHIKKNPKIWKDALVIITFDENGGAFDHVSPPTPSSNNNKTSSNQGNGNNGLLWGIDFDNNLNRLLGNILGNIPGAKNSNKGGNNNNSNNSSGKTADNWGPGTRIPAILVSPFAVNGGIDSTEYDQTAILKLIENRYNLKALSTRDAAQADITHSLQLH